MIWLRLVAFLGLVAGAWHGWAALPKPVRSKGRLYSRQPDGCYRRCYGGRAFSPDEIGL